MNSNINVQEFCREFPINSNKDLAVKYNVSEHSIIRYSKELHLEKDREYISNLRKKPRNTTNIPRGENHYNWKGGQTWERFKEPKYQEWRSRVLERDSYICQDCNTPRKKYEKGLAAHHLKSYKDFPELRYDIDNSITLCRNCHMIRHGKKIEIKQIPCGCGCGIMINDHDIYGRPRTFVNFHWTNIRPPMTKETAQKISNWHSGKILTKDHRRKITEGLKNSSKKIGRPKDSKNGQRSKIRLLDK